MVDPRFGQRGGFQQMGGGGQMRPQAPPSNTQRAFGSAMQSQVQQPQLMNQFVQGMRMNGGLLGSTTQNAAPAYGYQRLSWQGLMDQRAAEGRAAQEKLVQQQAAAAAGAAPALQTSQSVVSQLTPEQLQMLNMMNMSPDERAWRQAMGGGLYGGGYGGSANGASGNGTGDGIGSVGASDASATGGIGVDGQGTW